MKKDRDAVIVGMGRSAVGDFGGSLADLRAHELAAQVMRAVIQKAGIEAGELDDVILGDCIQCSDEANTARTAMLKCGIPHQVPAMTIQRQCASAMQAVVCAAQQIWCGNSDMVLAGGVESMSSAPYVLPQARWGARLRHGMMIDSMWELLHSGSTLVFPPGYILGMTAENLAVKYQIPREEQDIIALRSHQNAQAAINSGKFQEEITPISVPQKRGEPKVVDTDEHVRPGLKMEDLTRLKPVFKKDGTVTAGNASGLNDGASICLVTSRARARDLGLMPQAKILDSATAGCDPALMGWGPVPSTQKLLARTGVDLKDIELIELNEAFAAQYLACERGLDLNREITNVNGSGIGLGHPVGSTGARLIITLVHEMKRRGNTLGLAALCVGGGMGMSTLLEME